MYLLLLKVIKLTAGFQILRESISWLQQVFHSNMYIGIPGRHTAPSRLIRPHNHQDFWPIFKSTNYQYFQELWILLSSALLLLLRNSWINVLINWKLLLFDFSIHTWLLILKYGKSFNSFLWDKVFSWREIKNSISMSIVISYTKKKKEGARKFQIHIW